jgi:hypothetical protein
MWGKALRSEVFVRFTVRSKDARKSCHGNSVRLLDAVDRCITVSRDDREVGMASMPFRCLNSCKRASMPLLDAADRQLKVSRDDREAGTLFVVKLFSSVRDSGEKF